MTKYLAVMLGGALGSGFRFLVGMLMTRYYVGRFPLGTFVINVSGSFLIGVIMTMFLNRPAVHVNWRFFVVTGVLGGYTTFSSFEWEAFVALRGGAVNVGLLYLLASVALGLAVAYLGVVAGSRIWPHQ